ncbi:MAG: hypothetical protein QXS54_03120 [Candidatus Methanomethylicaceae archaeon]
MEITDEIDLNALQDSIRKAATSIWTGPDEKKGMLPFAIGGLIYQLSLCGVTNPLEVVANCTPAILRGLMEAYDQLNKDEEKTHAIFSILDAAHILHSTTVLAYAAETWEELELFFRKKRMKL